MTLKQLAKKVRQLGYHLEYHKYVEAKIAENSATIQSYLISAGQTSLMLGGYKVTLEETGLRLEVLPEDKLETISIFELLEKAS